MTASDFQPSPSRCPSGARRVVRPILTTAALLSLAACAAGPGRGRGPGGPDMDATPGPMRVTQNSVAEPVALMMVGFDRNLDAVIDRAELQGGAQRAFQAADGDGSGELSLIELSNWSETWLGSPSALPGRFNFDRDQSDTISPAEFSAEFGRQFDRFDINRDGRVTRAELLTLTRIRQSGAGAVDDRGRRRSDDPQD